MTTNDEECAKNPFRVYNASTLGSAIRHYRKAAGLTQEELAARTGMNRYYLNSLENGLETEHVNRLLLVFRELGVRMTLDKADW